MIISTGLKVVLAFEGPDETDASLEEGDEEAYPFDSGPAICSVSEAGRA